MNTSFFTKKTVFGIIAFVILIAGLAGGVYLSQQQTQVKSRASEACILGGEGVASYPGSVGSNEWCSCAAQNNDNGSLINGNCPQVQCNNLVTSNVCGGSIPAFDICTSTCENGRKVYNCHSSKNPNCVNNGIICSSETCGIAPQPADPDPQPASTKTDNGLCNQPQFYEGSSVAPFVVAGRTYNARITVQNNGTTTWTAGNGYKLAFPTSGDTWSGGLVNGSDWNISWLNSAEARVPVTGSIAPGQTATFSVNVTPKTDAAAQSKFFWRMIKEGSAWFGSACEMYTSITPASSGTGAVGTGNPNDGSKCETPQANLLDPKTNTRVPYVIENTEYIARLTLKNSGTSTWKAGEYILTPSDDTKTTWQANPLPLTQDVAPGGSKVFDVRVKSPATSNGEHSTVGYYFRITNNGVPFGEACEPQVIDITPAPVAAGATGTACVVMSESLTDVSSVTACDNSEALAKGIIKQYTDEPTTIPYSFQDNIVGIKTVYVRFISKSGELKDINKQIRFSPDPILDIIACTHSATGQGTLVGIRGQNFGAHRQQGAGYIKVNGQNATITSWDESRNVIIGTVPTRLEGEQSVELKLDDGRTVMGKCNVGISTVQFSVNSQCTIPGSFSATNVDVRIQEATSGARPILSKKININKGIPSDFAPTIETGKRYSLIIKGPETLARKIDFVADEGSKNLGEIKLWIGDIAPKVSPDGKINTLDKSEMGKQWSLLETTAPRSADLNKDGTVNSHDYSCQKLGFNQQDEVTITTSQSN